MVDVVTTAGDISVVSAAVQGPQGPAGAAGAPGASGGVWGTPQIINGLSVVDFAIPASVNLINVGFYQLRQSGSTPPKIQVGDSGGISTAGYSSGGLRHENGSMFQTSSSSGWEINNSATSNAMFSGMAQIMRVGRPFTTTKWVLFGQFHRVDNPVGGGTAWTTGETQLVNELITIRVAAGSGSFNTNGIINIFYQ